MAVELGDDRVFPCVDEVFVIEHWDLRPVQSQRFPVFANLQRVDRGGRDFLGINGRHLTQGDLALTTTDNNVELALSNLHGDVVATVPVTGTGAGPGITGWAQYDEYGNQLSEPVNTGATTYGWHGADQRAVDTSGLILMGARLYNSVTRLFTSRDPAEAGNSTSYANPKKSGER